MKELDNNNIPEHVAIVMDGNGRWRNNKISCVFLDIKRCGSRASRVSYARQTGIKF